MSAKHPSFCKAAILRRASGANRFYCQQTLSPVSTWPVAAAPDTEWPTSEHQLAIAFYILPPVAPRLGSHVSSLVPLNIKLKADFTLSLFVGTYSAASIGDPSNRTEGV